MSEAKDRIIGYIRDEDIKLDPAVKEKWLTALRSGDYEQCREWLNTNNSYCCLGVLAEVQGVPKTRVNVDSTGDTYSNYSFPCGNDFNCMLPENAYGLNFMVMSALAELNDDHDCSFNDIANIIEEHM